MKRERPDVEVRVGIRRLNHAVLYVRDVARSVEFYRDVLGFRVVHQRSSMAFLRAADSNNDHDLGLFGVRTNGMAAGAAPSIGLYHLAWSVTTLADLAKFEHRLIAADALIGSSDHLVSKSLYGRDPDGLEFEIAWFVPRDKVTPEMEETLEIRRLDIGAEIRRWGESLVGAP